MLHSPSDHKKRSLGLLLAALIAVLGLPLWSLGAKAASVPTSLGLALQGITAHKEGWIYVYGGKGGMVNGVRATDCAGLLYSYYSDCGVSGCAGGATSQVRQNTIFSGSSSRGFPAYTVWPLPTPSPVAMPILEYISGAASPATTPWRA